DLDGKFRKSVPRRDGEADAVDGDRAFVYDIAPEIFWNMHAVVPAFALGLQAGHAPGCVDVTEDEMATEFFAGSQRLFEIDARALVEAGGAGAEGGLEDGLAREIGGEAIVFERDDGEAASVDGDAVGDGERIGERGGVDGYAAAGNGEH